MFSKSVCFALLSISMAAFIEATPVLKNPNQDCAPPQTIVKTVTVTAAPSSNTGKASTGNGNTGAGQGNNNGNTGAGKGNNNGAGNTGNTGAGKGNNNNGAGNAPGNTGNTGAGKGNTGAGNTGNTGNTGAGKGNTGAGNTGNTGAGKGNTGAGNTGAGKGNNNGNTGAGQGNNGNTGAGKGNNGAGQGNGNGAGAFPGGNNGNGAGAFPGGAGGAGGDPQTSLTLDPKVLATGFKNNGQAVPTAGQVASLTSANNFINFCLTVPNLPITNGKQIVTGSCNPAPIGVIPNVDNMPSAKFTFPTNFGAVKANTAFTAKMAIRNLATGNFVNAQENYFAAPQQVNGQGIIIGHTHFVIEQLSSLAQTTPTDPGTFAFFKGINGAAVNGEVSTDVSDGLPEGAYRICSINSAANHQPVIAPVAQHGSMDDCSYFEATKDGKPTNNIIGGGGANVAPPAASLDASSGAVSATASASGVASASVSVSASATASGAASGVISASVSASGVASASVSASASAVPGRGGKGPKGGKGGKGGKGEASASVAPSSVAPSSAAQPSVTAAPGKGEKPTSPAAVPRPTESAKDGKGVKTPDTPVGKGAGKGPKDTVVGGFKPVPDAAADAKDATAASASASVAAAPSAAAKDATAKDATAEKTDKAAKKQ